MMQREPTPYVWLWQELERLLGQEKTDALHTVFNQKQREYVKHLDERQAHIDRLQARYSRWSEEE
jgi:hypothetical protein